MKKKHLKAQIQSLNQTIAVLEKKCTCLELIVKWQSERLDSKREMQIKQKAKDSLDKG
ncbi:hypothetical protein [Helicobacter sp. UBA3407]|uniref:hypothetical protein n=1 Tax=Helicobacter TaxID=209 RepID=UPI00262D5A89|nr:hypothetical protein [Helicobacter sp. UBA3407]